MGIRIKLAIVLAVAVVLPVIIGIVSVRWLGRSYFQSEKGALFQTTANHLSSKLRQGMQSEIAATVDWVTLSKLSQTTSELIAKTNSEGPLPPIIEIESKWPALSEENEPVRSILNNPVADRIARFQRARPYVVEVLVTDEQGRLIAASGKSSDYMQKDEIWWAKAYGSGFGETWVEGIHFDDSAEVFSMDVSMPIPDPESPGAPLG